MKIPTDLRFTRDHEWIRAEDDSATIGITEFAQDELGEIVFVELPEVGQELQKGETLCVVESTKAASDVYCPVSGKVIEVNSTLSESPDLVNSSPYKEGWMVKLELSDQDELSSLLDADKYEQVVES